MGESFVSMGGLCLEENGKRSLPPDLITEMEKNSEHGVIVNGVINWICVQKDTNAPVIWKSIAGMHYDDKELREAWNEIKKFGVKLGMKLPNFRTTKSNWLDDIGDAIDRMRNEQCMPLVMATTQMILRAPKFWGKDPANQANVDVAGLAGELKELKAAVTGFMQHSENQMKEIKQQQMARTPLPLGALSGAMTPKSAAKKRRLNFQENESSEDVSETEASNYANVTKKDISQKEQAAKALAAILAKKKAPEKSKVIYGSSKSEESEQNFAGDVAVVAFGVNKNCSTEAMKVFLEGKGLKVRDVIDMTRSEVLENVRVKTMKVVVKATDYEKVMDGSNWPSRVGVRMWEDKEAKKAKYDRWQEKVKNRSQVSQEGESATAPGAGSQGSKVVNSSYGRSDNRGFNSGNRSRGFMNKQKSGNRYEGDEIIALFRQVLMA